jgi:hypothetical protein
VQLVAHVHRERVEMSQVDVGVADEPGPVSGLLGALPHMVDQLNAEAAKDAPPDSKVGQLTIGLKLDTESFSAALAAVRQQLQEMQLLAVRVSEPAGTQALLEQLRLLTDEVRGLRADGAAAELAQRRTAKVLERMVDGADAVRTNTTPDGSAQ